MFHMLFREGLLEYGNEGMMGLKSRFNKSSCFTCFSGKGCWKGGMMG